MRQVDVNRQPSGEHQQSPCCAQLRHFSSDIMLAIHNVPPKPSNATKIEVATARVAPDQLGSQNEMTDRANKAAAMRIATTVPSLIRFIVSYSRGGRLHQPLRPRLRQRRFKGGQRGVNIGFGMGG